MKTRFFNPTVLFVAILSVMLLQSCASGLIMDEDKSGHLPHSDQSIFSVMNQQEVLEVTIVTAIDSILQKRKTEEYTQAEFSYEDANGVKHSFQAKTKPRGKFRRMTCDFPPLKFKFSKDELEAAGLTDMNEVKLVTHCLDDKETSRGLVMREYLAYKLYNELTPYSYRVQLVKVTYVDKNNPDYNMTRYGFLMEDKEELSWRNNGKVVDLMGTNPSELSVTNERLASVFQYMIGNTDWNVMMTRNVDLLQKNEGKFIPVPYDFDFSGMVAAPYARPNVDVGQKRVGERVFMGNAETAQELYATLNYYRTKKDDLLEIVDGFTLLDENSRNVVATYLQGFFAEIETQSSAQKTLFKASANQNGTVLQVKETIPIPSIKQ